MILDTSNGFTMVMVDSRNDCIDFNPLFNGLHGDFLLNPAKSALKRAVIGHPERPLIIAGHGDPCGIYNKAWNGYLIDSGMVQFLRKLPCVIGVWCYAGNFADKYGLKGFFTSMFISNKMEAVQEGFTADDEEIHHENIEFSKRLNRLIRTEPDMTKWVPSLQSYGMSRQPFVKFNYEAMALFE